MIRPCFFGVTWVLLTVAATAFGAQPADPYSVVWESPSAESNGTMPLGNGEIALNAWIEASGDLQFFIARTDAWDAYGRLLKVGGVRVRVNNQRTSEQATGEAIKAFRQTLTVKDGTMSVQYGAGEAGVAMRLWVDAKEPIVCVEITTAKPTEAALSTELWRTSPLTLATKQCSDVLNGRPDKTIVEPDTLVEGLSNRIGWYHRNQTSVGPALCAKIQGVADFARPDPLLHRTFGAVVATERPQRVDQRTLRSGLGTRHVFQMAVHTKHPATDQEWLAETQRILDDALAVPLTDRRAAHEKWWAKFWNRSWIHLSQNRNASPASGAEAAVPANKLPLSIGRNSRGGSRWQGTFGRVSVFDSALDDAQIAALAAQGPQEKLSAAGALYSDIPDGPKPLEHLADRAFAKGFTVEAWVKSDTLSADMRIIDKITPGGHDGFLFDVHPAKSLRLIVGRKAVWQANVLKPGVWQHVAAVVSPSGCGRLFLGGKAFNASGELSEGDDATVVTRAYALQRFIAACAGRGRYPIKFNGSLLTVPVPKQPGKADEPEHADYRRWGPGYWWQNTRLPYFAMCAAGDFDLMEPLFQMYARDLMPLQKYRTRRYLNHDGAYIPECIYFWGDMFSETYGWQPFEERKDKLQASRWHKWEWVSGLELACLLLDRYEHTEDAAFLRDTVLPTAREILTFFDQQYPLGQDGKLVMHPAQACETWWECTNPMPELAGLHSITARLAALPDSLTSADERAFWRRLQAKLPPLPTRISPAGKTMLAPAAAFAKKSNCECPELYAVFPFRLIALGKPNLDWGIEALTHRQDRGATGWRQEDIMMAYLGLADQARDYVVQRARHKHAASRFPAFWGPNYDWNPDQCHGSVFLRAVQAMLLQSDGRKIYLLPAWPQGWDCEFRLHAPHQTVVEGKIRNGKLEHWQVTPESRRKDVELLR